MSDSLAPLSQKHLPLATDESSMPASASELLLSDLSEKTRLLRIARKKARQYKMRCEALSSQMSFARKRQRDQTDLAQTASETAAEGAAPAKKPSPENRGKLNPPELVDDSDGASDDEVPLPAVEQDEARPRRTI